MTNEICPTSVSQKRLLRIAIACFIAWVGILIALVTISSVKPPENSATAPAG